MDKKIEGVLIGLACVLFWFAPFAEWNEDFMGQSMYYKVAGHHIGGIAYLLLASSFSYSVFAWLSQPHLKVVVACLSLLLSFILLLQIGSSISWGLMCFIFMSGYGAVSAKYEINNLKSQDSGSEI